VNLKPLGELNFGERTAEVLWLSVENPGVAAKQLDGFVEVARHETMADVGKGEKDLLEAGLKTVTPALSQALVTTGHSKVVVLLNKSLHSASLGERERGWLHNRVTLVFGVWRG